MLDELTAEAISLLEVSEQTLRRTVLERESVKDELQKEKDRHARTLEKHVDELQRQREQLETDYEVRLATLGSSVADAEMKLQEASEQIDNLTFVVTDLNAKNKILEEKVKFALNSVYILKLLLSIFNSK